MQNNTIGLVDYIDALIKSKADVKVYTKDKSKTFSGKIINMVSHNNELFGITLSDTAIDGNVDFDVVISYKVTSFVVLSEILSIEQKKF